MTAANETAGRSIATRLFCQEPIPARNVVFECELPIGHDGDHRALVGSGSEVSCAETKTAGKVIDLMAELKKSLKREPTEDERAGMDWWNSLTEAERASRLTPTVNSAAKAWEQHKALLAEQEQAKRCPRCDRELVMTPSKTFIECPCPPVDDLAILREHRRSELRAPVDVAIAHLIDAGTVLGLAHAKVMTLEDERPLIKAKCIEEMIGTPNPLTNKPHSAASAEAIVEKHGEYWRHRQAQIAAEIHKHEATANYEAMKIRARLMVAQVGAGRDE